MREVFAFIGFGRRRSASTAITTSPSARCTTAASCRSRARVRSRPTSTTSVSSRVRWARAATSCGVRVTRRRGCRARTAPAAGTGGPRPRSCSPRRTSPSRWQGKVWLADRAGVSRRRDPGRVQGHRRGDGRSGGPRRGPAHAAPGPQLQGDLSDRDWCSRIGGRVTFEASASSSLPNPEETRRCRSWCGCRSPAARRAEGPRRVAAHRQGLLPPGATAGRTSPRSSNASRAHLYVAAPPSISSSTVAGRTGRSSCSPTARGREYLLAIGTHRPPGPAEHALPTARAAGKQLEILVDSHERYPWTFAHQQATTRRRAPARWRLRRRGRRVHHRRGRAQDARRPGVHDAGGKLRYLLADLATPPVRRSSSRTATRRSSSSNMAPGDDRRVGSRGPLPDVPIVFTETRPSPRSGPTGSSAPPSPTTASTTGAMALAHRQPPTRRPDPRPRADQRRRPGMGPPTRAHHSRPRSPPPRDLGRLPQRVAEEIETLGELGGALTGVYRSEELDTLRDEWD